MVFARLFTTDDRAVRFEFDFERDESGELLLDVTIRWSYREDDTYRISRRNAGGMLIFDHTFGAGDRIHGHLKGINFFDSSVEDNAAVWGDFFYRHRNRDLGHFEGVMVSFPRDGVVFPDDEAPEPKAEGNGANGPRGKTIHLDARTWYVWKRNGGVERMLGMLCKPEYCSHCDEQRVSDESYHGWFCYTCQRTLANLNLLPDGDPKNDLEEEEPFVPAFLEDDEDEDED